MEFGASENDVVVVVGWIRSSAAGLTRFNSFD